MNTTVLKFILSTIVIAAGCHIEKYSQGKRLYSVHCANCHMEDGTGLGAIYPPLANSDYLTENQDRIACLIRYGISGPIVVNGIEYNQAMEPLPSLNYVEIHNILNYMNWAWNNQLPEVNFKDVVEQLESCAD